jgi:hypothetical protein
MREGKKRRERRKEGREGEGERRGADDLGH